MYWYKVKTLLIAMFALINVFLLTFIIHGEIKKNINEKKEIESIIAVLKTNGIEVDKKYFDMKSKPVGMAMVENLIPAADELAKVMLGDGFVKEEETGKYVKNEKSVIVDGGRFVYKVENCVADQTVSDDKIEVAINNLKKYGIDTSTAKASVSGDRIDFVYYFNGLPLYENSLYVKMRGSEPVEIGGYLIGFKKLDKKPVEISSPKNAIVSFLRDEKREEGPQKIVSISLGYSALLADSSVHFKNTETIPTYKITTDKNKVYYYDAR